MSGLREKVLAWIAEDEHALVDFFQRLVRTPTPNPPGDTRAAMALVTGFLDGEDLPYDLISARDDLPNLVATVEGGRPGRHLVMNGHLDVFPVGNADAWGRDPWSGNLEGGRLHGRGAADMKGGLTAAIFAFRYMARLREQLAGRVTLMAVSDEETGGRLGSEYVIERLGAAVLGDCLLSGEPGGVGTIRFGEKGILQFAIEIRTRGAHGPYAHLSPSAIRIAGRIMDELDAVKALAPDLPAPVARRLSGPAVHRVIDETMGEGTAEVMTAVSMNVGTITGGSKINMVPATCRMEVDIRVPIGVDRDRVLGMVHEIVARHPGATIVDVFGGPPLFSDPDHEMAGILSRNVTALGLPEPIRIPMLAGSDCRFWRAQGVPAFVYGTSPRNVSAPDESAVVAEFLHVVRVHALAALDYLTQTPGNQGSHADH